MGFSSSNQGSTSVTCVGSGNQLMYTVPAQKSFEGYLWNTSSNAYGVINGQCMYMPYASSYYVHDKLHVCLTAGDTVRADPSGTTMLQGVERA